MLELLAGRAIDFGKRLIVNLGWQVALASITAFPAIASETSDRIEKAGDRLDIPERVIQQSPTLQRWLEEVPDVLEEIRNDPSFQTRLRIGFTSFTSNDNAGGINVGIEDIFLDRTGITLSTDYQTAFNGDRQAVGADLHYFLFPLGNYVNLAPLVGYRYVQSNDFNTDGLHLGLRLMLVFSRTGAGDISLSQSFISPGSDREVGITSLSVGYAIASQLRLSTDLEWQNSIADRDSRAGVNLELLF